MKPFRLQLLLIISLFVFSCTKNSEEQSISPSAIKVEIRKEGDAYKLYRDGQPYRFNGAGMAGDMEAFAEHGGNSIRTWVEDREILDLAEEHGITVMMCFYIQPERHGMDYGDQAMKDKQFDRVKKFVLENKDHPALLAWCIGNELNLNYSDHRVYDEVNRISKWIHEVDPNHPTTTTTSSLNPELASVIKERAPDLDFLSVQVYGDLFVLQDMIQAAEWTKPYMVTEWGTIGHWEMPSTSWGAPIEQTSSQKADNYLKGYKKSIGPFLNQCIGNYVFLWGQKQERTPTWYGMFSTNGEETEAVDVMHFIWNDKWPDNRTPRVDGMYLDGKLPNENVELVSGESYVSKVDAKDVDDDSLTYSWVIMRESEEKKEGGDKESAPEELQTFDNMAENTLNIVAPEEAGAYRLFAYVSDGQGHVAHANIPFLVK